MLGGSVLNAQHQARDVGNSARQAVGVLAGSLIRALWPIKDVMHLGQGQFAIFNKWQRVSLAKFPDVLVIRVAHAGILP